MALDVEDLLAPVEGDDPAGQNLEYDPVRGRIVDAFQQISAITAGPPPEIDWRGVIGLIESQSRLTKDIWLPVYMARAGARLGDLAAVETGLLFLDGMVERYWQALYPKLEDLGVQGRVNACDTLGAPDGEISAEFIRPLHKAPLISHPRFGRFALVDLQRFERSREAEPDYGQFMSALSATSDEELADACERLARIAALLGAIEQRLATASGEDVSLGYKSTIGALGEMRQAVMRLRGAPADEGAAAGETSDPALSGTPAMQASGLAPPAGAIQSREQVIRALDAVADYYRRCEPGSPVLTALQRVRVWVGMDFMTLLEDIAPASLDSISLVLKSQRPPPG